MLFCRALESHSKETIIGSQDRTAVSRMQLKRGLCLLRIWTINLYSAGRGLKLFKRYLLTPKIGTHQICWTIWADRSDLSWKPVKTSLSYCKLDFTIA